MGNEIEFKRKLSTIGFKENAVSATMTWIQKEIKSRIGESGLMDHNPLRRSMFAIVFNGVGLQMLYYLEFLMKIEKMSKESIYNLFIEKGEIFCGSSSGACLVTLILCEIPLSTIHNIFMNQILPLFQHGAIKQEDFLSVLVANMGEYAEKTMKELAPSKKAILAVFDAEKKKLDIRTNYRPIDASRKIKHVLAEVTALPILFFTDLEPRDTKIFDAALICSADPTSLLIKEALFQNFDITGMLKLGVRSSLPSLKLPIIVSNVPENLLALLQLIEIDRVYERNLLFKERFYDADLYDFVLETPTFKPGFTSQQKQNLEDDIRNYLIKEENRMSRFLDTFRN